MAFAMTDSKIPVQCRNCIHCRRFAQIPEYLPLYDWEPWEWDCKYKNELWMHTECPSKSLG